MTERLSFSEAIELASAEEYESGGIGTYGEKMLHRTLKFYFEPDTRYHEVSHLGSVADILNDDGVIEIQTRSFNKLVPMLERFLSEDKVTVVFPIIESKYICRVDTESGESKPPRKSRKRGRAIDSLSEISMIRRFIPNSNLRILLVFVDVIETRLLNGKLKVGRKRTEKINCVPTALNSVIELCSPGDYLAVLPDNLPESFTASEFEACTRLRGIGAHGALMLLLQLGILTREREGGKAFVYTLNKSF